MKTRIFLPVLLLTAAFVSPASANWFHNPLWNLNLNLGSAPSPTPQDIREDKKPMLVRDADGNIIAMIDPATGKVLATAEPPATAQPARIAPAPARAR